jgi:hypothetical protein
VRQLDRSSWRPQEGPQYALVICPLKEIFFGGTRAAAEPTLDQQATSIPPPLNVKTARSWRGIVTFTHLAREGRMTVTIGRREYLKFFLDMGIRTVRGPEPIRAPDRHRWDG